MTHQIGQQRKRIDHLLVKTGRKPTVLDVPEATFDKLIEELIAMPRYDTAIPRSQPDEIRSIFKRNGFDLFGVRFVQGYVTENPLNKSAELRAKLAMAYSLFASLCSEDGVSDHLACYNVFHELREILSPTP